MIGTDTCSFMFMLSYNIQVQMSIIIFYPDKRTEQSFDLFWMIGILFIHNNNFIYIQQCVMEISNFQTITINSRKFPLLCEPVTYEYK